MDPFQQALDRIRELGREGRADEALGLCDKLIRHAPDNPEVLFLAGALHHSLGRPEEAIGFWRKALAIDPNHERASEWLAKLEFDLTPAETEPREKLPDSEKLFDEEDEEEEPLDPRCLFQRAGAFLIDSVLLAAAGVYVAMYLHPAAAFFLAWLYFAGFEASGAGATPGKRLMGIAVVYEDGGGLSPVGGAARFLGKVVSTLFFLLGHLLALFTRKRQTFHDRLAGTLVVRRGAEHPLQAALVTLGGASAIWLGISLGLVEAPKPAVRVGQAKPGAEVVTPPMRVGATVQAGLFQMRDEGSAYVFTMPLPGADVSSINSQWTNGQVMVSGRIIGATQDFHYAVPMSASADPEGVQHSYLDGVLTVTVPKSF